MFCLYTSLAKYTAEVLCCAVLFGEIGGGHGVQDLATGCRGLGGAAVALAVAWARPMRKGMALAAYACSRARFLEYTPAFFL